MDRYDPYRDPDPREWLELDERERILFVRRYHRDARIKIPNRLVHAVIHVIVENQLAMAVEVVRETFDRLRGEGLDRHDAIHAIGSVLAEEIYDALKGVSTGGGLEGRYQEALKSLTAASWRKKYSDTENSN